MFGSICLSICLFALTKGSLCLIREEHCVCMSVHSCLEYSAKCVSACQQSGNVCGHPCAVVRGLAVYIDSSTIRSENGPFWGTI